MKTLYEEAFGVLDKDQEQLLDEVIYFRIDNVAEFVTETGFNVTRETLPVISIPYDKIAMEFDVPSAGGNILYGMIKDTRVMFLIRARDGVFQEGSVDLRVSITIDQLDNCYLAQLSIGKDGKVLRTGNDGAVFKVRGTEETGQEVIRVIKSLMSLMTLSLGLMNCKNVDTIYIEPQPGRKRHKQSGSSSGYHILNIRPMTGTRKVYSSGDGKGDKKPFHICQGHFKTFTDAAPLFGRFVGTYWWSQQVRGSREVGHVRKSYKIGKVNK